MSVPAYIASLAALTGVDQQQIVHYLTGISRASASDDVIIAVPIGRCIVIDRIEQSDVDATVAHTIAVSSSSVAQTPAIPSELFAGTLDVLYFFPDGNHKFTIALTSAAGKTARTLFSYYELPAVGADMLKGCATRLLMQS